MPNMNSIQLKTKELLKFYFGCHDNYVFMARRYIASAYYPNEGPYQI